MPIFPPEPDHLFTQRSLSTLLRDQIHRMENAIEQLSDDLFLQNSPDDLIESIAEDAHLPPIELHLDKGVSHPPIEVDDMLIGVSLVPISGFRYAVEVPYTGASGLFNHEPETFDLDKPTARLNSHSMQGSIIISRIATAEITPDQLKEAFDAELAKVRKCIGFQALQIDPFNASLKTNLPGRGVGRRKLCAIRTCASRVRMLTASPQKQRAMPSARCVGSWSARACICCFQAPQSRWHRYVS